mmetsp:Transcript_28481/g.80961  ORF Transcript_28481/g.80961 Transcript_28481/m.80961 type:complete len:251 (+) Transcript_28481:81-833(+)
MAAVPWARLGLSAVVRPSARGVGRPSLVQWLARGPPGAVAMACGPRTCLPHAEALRPASAPRRRSVDALLADGFRQPPQARWFAPLWLAARRPRPPTASATPSLTSWACTLSATPTTTCWACTSSSTPSSTSWACTSSASPARQARTSSATPSTTSRARTSSATPSTTGWFCTASATPSFTSCAWACTSSATPSSSRWVCTSRATHVSFGRACTSQSVLVLPRLHLHPSAGPAPRRPQLLAGPLPCRPRR